jgi:predicted TIM-barrel fold metal-dependent hydrolase
MSKLLAIAAMPDVTTAQTAKTAMKIDSHAHVFLRSLKLAQFHRYIPGEDAPVEEYLSLLDRFHFTNGVIIQPSFLGTDNQYLLSALKSHPDRLRGVVVIDPARDLEKLAEWNDLGCTGIRLNLFDLPDPDLSHSDWRKAIKKMRDLDWQIELHVEARRLPELAPALLHSNLKVVIDHFGRPNPALGVDDPDFHYLLSLAESRRVWIKISAAYRSSNIGMDTKFALSAVSLFKKSFGLDRMVWGSDWPHTQFENRESYQSVYDLLLQMLPDQHERIVVLDSTPRKLYGFREKL